VARFMIEYHYPDGPRRQLHVTSEAMPRLEGVVLRDGTEIRFRGLRWNVARRPDQEAELWVLTPVAEASASG
jgi:hypothetical protein